MKNNKVQKQQGVLSSIIEFMGMLLLVFLIRTFVFGLYVVPTGSMETTMLVGGRYIADKFSYNFRKPRHGEIIAMNNPEFVYSDNKAQELFQRYVWGPDNWTKRVVGIPGDEIRGVIENGKPIIYRNGEKLDEPYINKYPLIHVWLQDFDLLRKDIEKELHTKFYGRRVDQTIIDNYVWQRFVKVQTWRSYDPSKPYDQQPFYRLSANRIYQTEDGSPELRTPGTPLMPTNGATTPDTTRNNWNGSDLFYVKLGADEYWGMGDNRLGSHDCRFFGPIREREIHGRIVFEIFSLDSEDSWFIIDLIKHPIDFWKRVRWSRFFHIMH